MYRRYLSRADYARIVRGYADYADGTYPHCNSRVRHAPGHCAFCDGFYLASPQERPAPGQETPDEANGWGGNVAPIVDDELAAAEAAAWDAVFDDLHVYDFDRVAFAVGAMPQGRYQATRYDTDDELVLKLWDLAGNSYDIRIPKQDR